MILGIAHAAYNVTDMEKAMDFYCGVLGFTRAFSMKNEAGEPWIEYLKVGNGQFVELFYKKPEDRGDTYSHLCLEVDDIQAMADHLVAMGAPLDVAPKQGRDRNWQCWTHDPDGNRVELMALAPDSPQRRAYQEEP